MPKNNSSETKKCLEAIAAIHVTLLSKPDLAIARYDLGTLYLKTGQRSAAILQLRLLEKYDTQMAEKLSEMIFPSSSKPAGK